MVKCVIITKFGEVQTSKIEDMELLYKKCKFRKKDNFKQRHCWTLLMNKNPLYIYLYAKDEGRPASINKYELPPPIDKDLFYGAIAIVASTDDELQEKIDFPKARWEKVYEKLMGGFEDLDKTEEESEEEYIPPEFKTQQGYSKENNFIVDDDEIEYATPSSDESEDAYIYSEAETASTPSSFNHDEEDNKSIEDEDEEQDADDELTEPDSELSEEEYIKEN